MVRVLMVCLGNICRSPMAEAVFAHMVNEAGLGHAIEVDSAGTSGWHIGDRADARTLRVLAQNNIPYDGRGRQLEPDDLRSFDYVLAMDYDNLANIQRMEIKTNASAEIRLFLSYANASGVLVEQQVPDPYYDGSFDNVYRLVTAGSKALLDHIRKQHAL